MSDQPAAPADPAAVEENLHIAVVSDYLANRKAGASRVDAAFLTAAYRVMAEKANEEASGVRVLSRAPLAL